MKALHENIQKMSEESSFQLLRSTLHVHHLECEQHNISIHEYSYYRSLPTLNVSSKQRYGSWFPVNRRTFITELVHRLLRTE